MSGWNVRMSWISPEAFGIHLLFVFGVTPLLQGICGAGKCLGMSDERSGLVRSVFTVLDASPQVWLVPNQILC